MDKRLFLLDDTHFEVGEGPTWDERTNKLHIVAFREKFIRTIDFKNAESKNTYYPGLISCLALCKNGRIMAATEKNISFLNEDGSFSTFCDVPNFLGRRFNDGKVGPDGRLYVGSKDANHEAAFYSINHDGSSRKLLDHVGCSNGIAWSGDGKTLFFCDSPDKCLEAFNFDAESGNISNRRIIMDVPGGVGELDGMSIDSEDMLWIAVWGSGKVFRIDPYAGKIIDTVSLPATQVSCCSFAGESLDTLIITTSAFETNLNNEPMAGCTYAMKVDVPGQPGRRFNI